MTFFKQWLRQRSMVQGAIAGGNSAGGLAAPRRLGPLAVGGMLAIALVGAVSHLNRPDSEGPFLTATAQPFFPDPRTDIPSSSVKGEQTLVLAGGCFWGMEAVFEHLKGVSKVVSGFSGGDAASAHYETVSTGRTGHAEAIQITYNPAKISYGQLLKVYFAVAHDPTQLNRQGPDWGTQYRSAIFVANKDQQRVANAYIQQLNQAHLFSKPIVTQVVSLNGFYAAEDYHQNFIARNPNYPYVVVHDLPKLNQLKRQFPGLYKT